MDFLFHMTDPGYSDEALYDIAFTLAGPETTLEHDHLAVCTGIWRNAKHRPWLAAAMLRRCEPGPHEPDDATLRFVVRRLLEDVKARAPVDANDLLEPIPILVLLMLDEAWGRPAELWDTFLRVAVDQLTLPGAELPSVTRGVPEDTIKLASVFADAVNRPWTPELDERTRTLMGRYPWLAGLRDAARVDSAMQQLLEARPPDGRTASAK